MISGFIRKNTFIHTLRASSVHIRRKSDGITHIDGEPAVMTAEMEVCCHHSGIKVFAPTRTTRFIPVLTPVYYTVREAGMIICRVFRNIIRRD